MFVVYEFLDAVHYYRQKW